MTASVKPPAMIIASEAWLSTLTKLLNVGNACGREEGEDDDHRESPMIVA